MSKSVVRTSKFRHVHGSVGRKEECYDNVQCTSSAADSNLIAANEKYFAVPWQGGGGPFFVNQLDKPGKVDATPSLFQGHSGAVLDLDFSPFDSEVIASASEDSIIRVWNFKKYVDASTGLSLKEDVKEDDSAALRGHSKKVTLIRWHPVASNLLLSVSFDNTARVWDVNKGAEALNIADADEPMQHVSWNYIGSAYAATLKDKSIRIYDPRAGAMSARLEGHTGAKGARVCFLGRMDLLASVGFSRQSERQLFLWDQRSPAKPLSETTIDTASGALLPFYDDDTGLLFIGGKGDGNVRYYEMSEDKPWMHYIDQHTGREPQRGLCMVPKRALHVDRSEIARLLRLCKGAVEPLSFEVPRKPGLFHEDLYPPTFSGRPALTADAWLGGATARPDLVQLTSSLPSAGPLQRSGGSLEDVGEAAEADKGPEPAKEEKATAKTDDKAAAAAEEKAAKEKAAKEAAAKEAAAKEAAAKEAAAKEAAAKEAAAPGDKAKKAQDKKGKQATPAKAKGPADSDATESADCSGSAAQDAPPPSSITVDLSGATGDVTVTGLVTVSVPAVAALQRKVALLEARVAELEAENRALRNA